MKNQKKCPQAPRYTTPRLCLIPPTHHLQTDPQFSIVLLRAPPSSLFLGSLSPTFRCFSICKLFEPSRFLICSGPSVCSLMPVSATRWHARHVTFGSGTRPCLVLSVTIIHHRHRRPPFFPSIFSFFSLFPVTSLSIYSCSSSFLLHILQASVLLRIHTAMHQS
ncbi:hypothetical protein HDV62DRAFT_262602 [Trichoderma sp. SZMC 28011]